MLFLVELSALEAFFGVDDCAFNKEHTYMVRSDGQESSLHAFIRNPQVHGVWCLRAYFSAEARKELISLLNFDRNAGLPIRRAYGGLEEPPLILLRLFAYLRALIPKSARRDLRPLFLNPQNSPSRTIQYSPRHSPLRRYLYVLEEMSREPPGLGGNKRKALAAATKVYNEKLSNCAGFVVPQNPTKLDFSDRARSIYFQIAEDPSGAIRIYAPHQHTIQALMGLLGALPNVPVDFEVTKQFSPEEALMEMYIPILRSLPIESILWDKRTIHNIHQALEDLREERFVHAIRAVGIAVEELLVEIYETYLREKAPEVPLGSLLNEFLSRAQETVQGAKRKQEFNMGAIRKDLGKILEGEKKKPTPNLELASLLEVFQRSIVPMLDELGGTAAVLRDQMEEFASDRSRLQKFQIFPPYVYRCLSGLIPLRNRVSHREEKSGSTGLIGYIEASTAVRTFIVLATWWQQERTKIDYNAEKREVLRQTAERSRAGS